MLNTEKEMSESEGASVLHKKKRKKNPNKHDLKHAETSLKDRITQSDLDITVKKEEMVDCTSLIINGIEYQMVGQSMNKEDSIKVTPMKTNICNPKDTNEDIENTFDLITEAMEYISPKKEYLEGQDNFSNKVENILCTPMKRIQNLLKDEIISPIANFEVDQFKENFENIIRTPRIGKHGYSQNNTPVKLHGSQKKRKISTSTDSNSKSNKVKHELIESTFINELDSVQFLHDFDSLIEFEDCKMSDVLLSSVMLDDVMQDATEGSESSNKELPIDPLAIDELEEPKRKSKSAKINNTRKVAHPLKQTRLRTRMQERKKCSPKRSSVWNTNQSLNIKQIKEQIEAIKEQEELSLNDISKLMQLEIQLQHTVPPQHKIEGHAGTHAPTKKETGEFQKYGPLRKESFLPTEDKIIQDNWKMFCKLHDWDVKNTKPFQQMKYGDKCYINSSQERQKFVQFLANGLPWRTLYSVYTRFKTLNTDQKVKRKKYTPEEDKLLLACLNNNSLKEHEIPTIPELAKLLRRTAKSVNAHIKFLRKNEKIEKGRILMKVKWTLPLIEEYIKHLIEVTLSKNVDELKDTIIPHVVWSKMESILRIRAYLLRAFWERQLHMQLFCPHPIYLNDIRIQLIEYMYGKGIEHKNEVNWPGVAKYFDGMTPIFLSRTFSDLFHTDDIYLDRENFADAVGYLYECIIPQLKEEHTDKFLPRLKYTKTGIELVDEIPDDVDV